MNSLPLISVIIPNYNRAYIIEETLASISSQTYQNWECIIVDDGSTDNSFEIINEWILKNPKFKLFKRPVHSTKGANACRNYGYEKSNGEYVQWFDSDDLMHPDKLKIKLEQAIKFNADVVIDQHSENIDFKKIERVKTECFTSSDFYIDFMLGKKPVITNDVMLCKRIIGKERLDENLHHGEEFEFFSRIFQQKLTYCFIDDPLTFYRVSPDSISRSGKQDLSLIKLSKKIQTSHPDQPLIIARAKRQGRKTYKNLIKHYRVGLILQNFHFFRKSYKKSSLIFLFLIFYNLITQKGFDRMKPKKEI